MLVYGDVERMETGEARKIAIASALARARGLPPGIERHTTLVAAFIEASELVQGLIDAEFEERGFDARSPLHDAGMDCLCVLARCIAQSWRSGLAEGFPPDSALDELFNLTPPGPLRTKYAEGYAFYTLYPESCLEAAALSELGPATRVIGIRSIGAGLSALVAGALGSPPPLTLRPVGHPFRREIRVDPAITAELAANKDATFAIVDEGPGLSGSSFGAVADWLEAAGIPRGRIHFFPSHTGELGPQASQGHRERWASAARHVVEADSLLLQPRDAPRLAAWVEDMVGPLNHPLEDLSGGAWREKHYTSEQDWPAANIQHERRKFLAGTRDAAWLVKFIGLGEIGFRKYEQARELAKAGFTPEVAGYRHGFIVERWHANALTLDQSPVERERLVEHVGSYLGFRVRRFPAQTEGASLGQLRHMACYNTQQALGDRAAATLDRCMPNTGSLEAKVRRISTDGRLHAWEWLVVGERLIKTDAVDHSATHDLIGPQDIGWDVAAAAVELAFSEDEVSRLCAIVGQASGYPVLPEIVTFMRPCYLAFQVGTHTMAAAAVGEGREAMRLRRAAAHYASLLPVS